MEYGSTIRRLRKALHLSQRDLARAIGAEPPQVSKWENNRVRPLKSLGRLAAGLGIPLSKLVSEAERDAMSPIVAVNAGEPE